MGARYHGRADNNIQHTLDACPLSTARFAACQTTVTSPQRRAGKLGGVLRLWSAVHMN